MSDDKPSAGRPPLAQLGLLLVVVLMLMANVFLVHQKRQLEHQIDRQADRILSLQKQVEAAGPVSAGQPAADPVEERGHE